MPYGRDRMGLVPTYVAVVGPADATDTDTALAREVGALLARAGCVVVTGGLGGVMGAAVEAAASAGGLTLGLLPDDDRARAHPALTLSVPTGMGEMRNALVVRSSDGIVAVGGSWGTLSEIALAMRTGRPVVQIGGWDLEPYGSITRYESAEPAVQAMLDLLS
jgi:uncharacterized protein (TIGR00725 family)